MHEQRISAAAIVLQQGKVLLVRYHNPKGASFLVGPGGGVKSEESLTQAIVREVKEETGLEVQPSKILFVENLLTTKYRMVKVWFLCSVVSGAAAQTQEALQEGIIEAGWYSKEQLADEIVYPVLLKEVEWSAFSDDSWQAKDLELQKADF